jgi:sterol desaturase/sphingolipid hydroxylase (fatty acid hydroxylase superfamily)
LLDQITQITVARAWWLAIAIGCCSALELVLPGERHSLASRLRGVGFMACYLATGVTLYTTAVLVIGRLGYAPLLVLDLTSTPASQNRLVCALGYTLFPFAALLWSELFYYWFHRLQHAFSILWRLHSVHHSIAELNAANSYHHFSEEFLRIPIVVIPALFIVQVHSPLFVLTSYFLSVAGQLQHTNSRIYYGPLRYLWGEPRFHRVHHSIEERHRNKNFSTSIPLIDWLFGTLYMPRRDEYPATGVAGQPEPRTLGQYFLPPPARSEERQQDVASASV